MDLNDPLSKLVVKDLNEIDRQKLADLLGPFTYFDETGETIKFKDKFHELGTNAEKLEIILLADKARILIFKGNRNEGMSQTDILKLEAMPDGSVKTTIKRLSDSRQISKNPDGKYFIPGYKLNELILKFKKNKTYE